jgi:phospholipid/cholesterol/gamma-HCH transport system substrate-binding protein
MKVSNETKVGALTAIAITLLILGFNFLKGKSLLEKTFHLYAKFSSVEGLSVSNAVMINGLPVGKVYEIEESDKNLSDIIVTINLTKNINIPKNSLAYISTSLLGNTALNIKMGNASAYAKNGDTLTTNISSGLLEEVTGRLDPTLLKVNITLRSMDSVLQLIGGALDADAQKNFGHILANLAISTGHLNNLLNAQTGALAQTLSNAAAFTNNLKKNNDTITQIFSNLNATTKKLADLELEQTLTKLQTVAAELNTTLNKINTNEGSLGLLMNDKKLYTNLTSASNSLNVLLQDFRIHPRRYTGGLVFGKKDKSAPLMTPLPDTLSVAPSDKNK